MCDWIDVSTNCIYMYFGLLVHSNYVVVIVSVNIIKSKKRERDRQTNSTKNKIDKERKVSWRSSSNSKSLTGEKCEVTIWICAQQQQQKKVWKCCMCVRACMCQTNYRNGQIFYYRIEREREREKKRIFQVCEKRERERERNMINDSARSCNAKHHQKNS